MNVREQQVPQPWHHASTFTHQAALAVAKLSPDSFQSYFSALMAKQTDFFDEPTVDETPNQTKDRLAALAEEVTGGKVKKAQVVELIKTGKGNAGSQVDKDLKLAVRYHRQNGASVSCTLEGSC